MAKVTRGPSLYSAMRARMGGENYFILTMAAWDLARRCGWPQKIEGWDENLSIEERYQRDINYNRVRKQIAPYLANDDSRFFGAVIVAAMNFGEEVSFEPLAEMTTKGLPGLYRKAATNMGFLTFEGGELLVPLDGQHRLKAIEFAVTGRDERGRDIADIKPCTQLAQEDVTVILVPYIPQRARKIFTRVNRYARPTTTGQNIVTDDDDILAVLTREVANDLIGGRLAKYSSNTLTTKDPEFTTLAIVYNCNEAIITNSFPGGKLDTTQLPEVPKIKLYRNKVREVWQGLLENIEVFADALSDKEETGDEKRREIRDTNLLGKPVVQECLVRAFIRLTGDPSNMGSEKACEKLNALPWNITEENLEIWQGILWAGGVDGKIITKNRKLEHFPPSCSGGVVSVLGCPPRGGKMQAYSLDLRARVVADRAAGLLTAEVARKYRVSPAWVRRLMQRYRASGQIGPKRRTQSRVPTLAPHLPRLAALIAAQPDATLAELRTALGVPVGLTTVWRAVRQLGMTVKKSPARGRTRAA